MRNDRTPTSLADAPITLSGVMHAQPQGTTHLPLDAALQLALHVVRLVAKSHDQGKVIGVLDAAHLVCLPDGALGFGGSGGNPIAPELKRGDAPDRLSDVYALGAVIYRLLCGRKVETSRLIEPPSHFNPAVDTSLDELVLETLDEDPAERPYSARELERRLLEVFDELGLEPTEHGEARKLITSSQAAYKPKPAPQAQPRPQPQRKVVARRMEEEDDEPVVKPQRKAAVARKLEEEDDDELAQPQSGFGKFLYDLGWVKSAPVMKAEPAWTRAPLGDDEPLASNVHERPRNRLSKFMYDLGWLQNIDWDAPSTLMWLKRGGIGLAALLLLVIVWPSNKEPRLTAAQKALVSQTRKTAEPTEAKTKPVIVAKETGKTTKTARR